MHYRAKFRKIGETVLEILQFFLFFKMAVVHYLRFVVGHFGTTHEEYLKVFIVVQNVLSMIAGSLYSSFHYSKV